MTTILARLVCFILAISVSVSQIYLSSFLRPPPPPSVQEKLIPVGPAFRPSQRLSHSALEHHKRNEAKDSIDLATRSPLSLYPTTIRFTAQDVVQKAVLSNWYEVTTYKPRFRPLFSRKQQKDITRSQHDSSGRQDRSRLMTAAESSHAVFFFFQNQSTLTTPNNSFHFTTKSDKPTDLSLNVLSLFAGTQNIPGKRQKMAPISSSQKFIKKKKPKKDSIRATSKTQLQRPFSFALLIRNEELRSKNRPSREFIFTTTAKPESNVQKDDSFLSLLHRKLGNNNTSKTFTGKFNYFLPDGPSTNKLPRPSSIWFDQDVEELQLSEVIVSPIDLLDTVSGNDINLKSIQDRNNGSVLLETFPIWYSVNSSVSSTFSMSSTSDNHNSTDRVGSDSIYITTRVSSCPKLYNTVKLLCEASQRLKEKEMDFSWTKKTFRAGARDDLVAMNDKIMMPEPRYTVSLTKRHSTLEIEDFQPQDSGTYECQVKTNSYAASSQILLFTCF